MQLYTVHIFNMASMMTTTVVFITNLFLIRYCDTSTYMFFWDGKFKPVIKRLKDQIKR